MKRILLLLACLLPVFSCAGSHYVAPNKVFEGVILTNPSNGSPYTSSAPVPVSVSSTSLYSPVIVDISGTITTGGTSQTLRAATAADKSIEIYNNDSTEPLCFKYGTTASLTAVSNICIPALGYYSGTFNNQRIDVIATTTGHKFTALIRQ